MLLGCLTATTYFAYHAAFGRHGWETHKALTQRMELADFELKSLNQVRDRLNRDVRLLSAELPDPDMVEDLARDVLGYVDPSDRILAEQTVR